MHCRHGDSRKEGVIFWYRGGTEVPHTPKFGEDLGIAPAVHLPDRCRFCKESEGK